MTDPNPSPSLPNPPDLQRQVYQQRLEVDRLRREVFGQADPSADPALLEALAQAEAVLDALEGQQAALGQDPTAGLILDAGEPERAPIMRGLGDLATPPSGARRGLSTTGLQAKIFLSMAQVPTAIYHLLDRQENPLVICEVTAARGRSAATRRRVRVSSFIDGYSARAVDTVELAGDETVQIKQLPTLFPDRARQVEELTRATLNVLVEDLEGGFTGRVELQATHPIWLLARTCAPLAVLDPRSGRLQDLSRYFGAFVTPNAPALLKFLREAARLHPEHSLAGYQGDPQAVAPQVEALFKALKNTAEVAYVNSPLSFNPQQGAASQRVRLPRESLADAEANCMDGAVLFASLLEGISLSPALALVPGHALAAWETWSGSGEWRFLETTLIGSSTFEEACASGEKTAEFYRRAGRLNLLPLRELRTEHGIWPME
jgi:hypothetical protein